MLHYLGKTLHDILFQLTSSGMPERSGGSLLHGSLSMKILTGSSSVDSRPPKFLLMACSSWGHVGGLSDFSHIQYNILIKLEKWTQYYIAEQWCSPVATVYSVLPWSQLYSCTNLPVEISQAKELTLLVVTNLHICFREGLEVLLQSSFHRIIFLIRADALGAVLQLIFRGVSPGHHHSSVHLGWIQGPVGDTNEGNSLLSGNDLSKKWVWVQISRGIFVGKIHVSTNILEPYMITKKIICNAAKSTCIYNQYNYHLDYKW